MGDSRSIPGLPDRGHGIPTTAFRYLITKKKLVFMAEIGHTSAMNTKQKKEHRRLGLCTSCSEPVLEGHYLCSKHLEAHRRATHNYDFKNRTSGKCPLCGTPVDGDYVRCPRCNESEQARRLHRLALGSRGPRRCTRCGYVMDEFSLLAGYKTCGRCAR